MTAKDIKPKLVVSRCFFEHTRYDGGIISSEIVRKLEKYCDFIKVCPEVEIGLPVPREPIDVFLIKNELRLMNKTMSEDLTDKMVYFSHKFTDSLPNDIDGMILKIQVSILWLKRCKIVWRKRESHCKNARFVCKSYVGKVPSSCY